METTSTSRSQRAGAPAIPALPSRPPTPRRRFYSRPARSGPPDHGFSPPVIRNGTYSIVIVRSGKPDLPGGRRAALATDARSNGNGASAGRPRSEVAHQAILDATLELLTEVGFSALTVEGVA